MAMNYIERQLRATGDPRDLDFARRIAAIRIERGQDISLSEDKLLTLEKKAESALRRYDVYFVTNWHRQEWRKPENVIQVTQDAWQSFWDLSASRGGFGNMKLPSCPYTPDDIFALEDNKRVPIYVPDNLATDEGRSLLSKAFPATKGYKKTDGYQNEIIQQGWMDIDLDWSKINPGENPVPNDDLTEAEVKEKFQAEGTELATLNTLVVASQFVHRLKGIYLVEGPNQSRVATRFAESIYPSSRFLREQSVYLLMHRNGYQGGGYRQPTEHYKGFGAYSVGRKELPNENS